MKSIKISEENKIAIESALAGANGKSFAHAYTTFEQVIEEKNYAEESAMRLLNNKKVAVGARLITTSGDSVANAYKYARRGTCLTIVCKSSGWHLESVSRVRIFSSGGSRQIVLTIAQSEKAKADFTKQFVVGGQA